MAQIGYSAGLANVTKYANDLRTKLNTDWAYVAFFTKYPVGHFAYASIGGPRLVMDYANDGWGPDNIDRVFAHESGHIFGAPDEYASSGCDCAGSWGYYGKPNLNCESCAPGGGVKCLMRSNDWEMCSETPYHLGFPLAEQRYSGVFRAQTGKYALWLNASYESFAAKWQEWAGQGLRLADLDIVQVGSERRYNGVWVAGTDGYGLWVNAEWASFVAKWTEWANQGLRLVCLEVVRSGSTNLYSGVFRAGTGAYGLWANATWDSFNAKWKEWANQNLRLVDLTITNFGNERRYSGVFRAGTDGYGSCGSTPIGRRSRPNGRNGRKPTFVWSISRSRTSMAAALLGRFGAAATVMACVGQCQLAEFQGKMGGVERSGHASARPGGDRSGEHGQFADEKRCDGDGFGYRG